MQHTVLVIDDQWSMQELARVVLQTAGYRVLLAGDTITGLVLARMEQPSLLILDYSLLSVSAGHLLDALHDDPKSAPLPIVFIINPGDDPGRARAAAPARSACLRKPFHPAVLLQLVDRLLVPRVGAGRRGVAQTRWGIQNVTAMHLEKQPPNSC